MLIMIIIQYFRSCQSSRIFQLLNRRGGENGVTPLLAAVQKGDTTVVSALVTSGADVNAQEDTSKRTPLHYALYTRKRDLFEYLLQ